VIHPFLRQALVALFLQQADSARCIEADWSPKDIWTRREKKRKTVGAVGKRTTNTHLPNPHRNEFPVEIHKYWRDYSERKG